MKYILCLLLLLGCGENEENGGCFIGEPQFLQEKFLESLQSCDGQIIKTICEGAIEHTYRDNGGLHTEKVITKTIYETFYSKDYKFETFNGELKNVSKGNCFVGVPLNTKFWYLASDCVTRQMKICNK